MWKWTWFVESDRVIEQIFERHFSPKKHCIAGIAELLKLKKRNDETISEYFLRVKRKAAEYHAEEGVIHSDGRI